MPLQGGKPPQGLKRGSSSEGHAPSKAAKHDDTKQKGSAAQMLPSLKDVSRFSARKKDFRTENRLLTELCSFGVRCCLHVPALFK